MTPHETWSHDRIGVASSALCVSPAMQNVARLIARATAGRTGVLIVGEHGSGRAWIARAISTSIACEDVGSVDRLLAAVVRESPGSRMAVALDCSDRDGLGERLFGAPAPARTTAGRDVERIAYGSALHTAMSGTLVLRQLTEMPERLQHRLATILRQGDVFVVRPDGEEILFDLAVRAIATADTDGESAIHPELLRRIGQTRIAVPPLRQRREDIAGLVRLLLDDLGEGTDGPAPSVSRQALELLEALPWRGNVRELDDVLRAAVQASSGRRLRLRHVLSCIRLDGGSSGPGYSGTLREAREAFERDYVAAVLERHRGRMAEAAKSLGLQRTNLYRKVRQLALPPRQPRRLSSGRYTEIGAASLLEPDRADTPSDCSRIARDVPARGRAEL